MLCSSALSAIALRIFLLQFKAYITMDLCMQADDAEKTFPSCNPVKKKRICCSKEWVSDCYFCEDLPIKTLCARLAVVLNSDPPAVVKLWPG